MIEPIVSILIQTDDFSQDQILRSMRDISSGIGAVCCFTGLMRDSNDGHGVQAMTLEHYPGMTEKSIAAIIEEAATRWPLLAATVVHRVGTLSPSDQIVLVAVASSHRQDAFSACEFIMDFLKTRAPFWKKERTDNGERWVDSRSSDDDAAKRW